MYYFAQILWQPTTVFNHINKNKSVLSAIALIIIIDSFLCLLSLPHAREQMMTNTQMQGVNFEDVKYVAITTYIFFGSIANIILTAIISVILMMIVLLFDGEINFKKLFSVLIIASAPSVIDRVTRIVANYLEYTNSPTEQIFTLQQLVPASVNQLLGHYSTYINVLEIWTLILSSLGFALVSSMKKTTAFLSCLFILSLTQIVLIRLQM